MGNHKPHCLFFASLTLPILSFLPIHITPSFWPPFRTTHNTSYKTLIQHYQHNQQHHHHQQQQQQHCPLRIFKPILQHSPKPHHITQHLPGRQHKSSHTMSYQYGYCYTCHRYVPVYTRSSRRHRYDSSSACCDACRSSRRHHYRRRYRYHTSHRYRHYPFNWRYPLRDRFHILPVY